MNGHAREKYLMITVEFPDEDICLNAQLSLLSFPVFLLVLGRGVVDLPEECSVSFF